MRVTKRAKELIEQMHYDKLQLASDNAGQTFLYDTANEVWVPMYEHTIQADLEEIKGLYEE